MPGEAVPLPSVALSAAGSAASVPGEAVPLPSAAPPPCPACSLPPPACTCRTAASDSTFTSAHASALASCSYVFTVATTVALLASADSGGEVPAPSACGWAGAVASAPATTRRRMSPASLPARAVRTVGAASSGWTLNPCEHSPCSGDDGLRGEEGLRQWTGLLRQLPPPEPPLAEPGDAAAWLELEGVAGVGRGSWGW